MYYTKRCSSCSLCLATLPWLQPLRDFRLPVAKSWCRFQKPLVRNLWYPGSQEFKQTVNTHALLMQGKLLRTVEPMNTILFEAFVCSWTTTGKKKNVALLKDCTLRCVAHNTFQQWILYLIIKKKKKTLIILVTHHSSPMTPVSTSIGSEKQVHWAS